MKQQEIIDVIYKAIDEVNEQQDDDALKIEKTLATEIFGQKGTLDSLGLVNFIVVLQEIVADEFDVEIMLADERTLCQENCPFRTVEVLADYILELIEESRDGK